MLFAVILCIVWGFTPTVLASQYSESVPVKSEYSKTPASENAENCDGIGYLPPNPNLNEAESRGRCTWYLWTGGNDKYYRNVAKQTRGKVDLLSLLDSTIIDRDKRFEVFGTLNDPGCEKATEPDEYGLLLDKCKDPQSSGIIGLRKFLNPNFDRLTLPMPSCEGKLLRGLA